MEVLLTLVGGAALIAFLVTFAALCHGYVLSVLWGWFFVPIFGAPALTLPMAVGVALVVSFMTHQSNNCRKEDKELSTQIVEAIIETIIHAGLVLLVGWVLLKFV